MPYIWRRPTPEQSARKIIAVYVLVYRVNVAKKETDTPVYAEIEMATPYRAINVERRIKRGGDLPDWITKREKVAIVGSRDYPDAQHIIDYVNSLPDTSIVVSGGARGVDSIAEDTAKLRGMDTLVFPAEWDKYGKSAGFRRNVDIANACDRLVAFWDGESRGTKHSIGLAEKLGKQVAINPVVQSLDSKPAYDIDKILYGTELEAETELARVS